MPASTLSRRQRVPLAHKKANDSSAASTKITKSSANSFPSVASDKRFNNTSITP